MRPAVLAPVRKLSEEREGRCAHLYCDRLGKVTAGVGHLCDRIADALRLPWIRPDGLRASPVEVADAWDAVKKNKDLAILHGVGGGSHLWKELTTIRLSEAEIDALLISDISVADRKMCARYPGYEQWPADAQLGALSMAFAMGAAFRFPHFDTAVLGLDFETAARECHMDDSRDGNLAKRNAANRIAFQNAAVVMRDGLDPDVVYWPQDLTLPPLAAA